MTRRWLPALVSVLMVCVLAGCHGSADAGPEPAITDAASAFPVTIAHELGETVVEAEPVRVVAMYELDAEILLSLGVVPVGIKSQYGHPHGVGAWAEAELGGAEPEAWPAGDPNYEAIAADQAAAHPEFAGRTITYWDMWDGQASEYAADHGVDSMLYRLGFEPTDGSRELAEKGENSQTFSGENLSDHDADIVLAYTFGLDKAGLEKAYPALTGVDSYRHDRLFILEDLAFSTRSPLAMHHALDTLIPQMSKALQE